MNDATDNRLPSTIGDPRLSPGPTATQPGGPDPNVIPPVPPAPRPGDPSPTPNLPGGPPAPAPPTQPPVPPSNPPTMG